MRARSVDISQSTPSQSTSYLSRRRLAECERVHRDVVKQEPGWHPLEPRPVQMTRGNTYPRTCPSTRRNRAGRGVTNHKWITTQAARGTSPPYHGSKGRRRVRRAAWHALTVWCLTCPGRPPSECHYYRTKRRCCRLRSPTEYVGP